MILGNGFTKELDIIFVRNNFLFSISRVQPPVERKSDKRSASSVSMTDKNNERVLIGIS